MFCTICGKKRKKVNTGYFNAKTGKPIYYYERCPVKDCKHGVHDYSFAGLGRCKNCNQKGMSLF